MYILVFLAIWCVVHLANSYESEEYKIQNITQMTCSERDSCRFILRQPAFWRQRKSSFLSRNCECDRKCLDYGDCCSDYKNRATENHGFKRKNFQMKCISSGLLNVGAYVISGCPNRYAGSQLIKSMCLNESTIGDPLMATPVTDPNTKLTYKNRYCAECNRANPNLLLSWLIRLNCDGLNSSEAIKNSFIWNNVSYTSTLHSWSITDEQGVRYNCKVEFSLPFYLRRRVRFCRPNIISSCLNDWDDDSVQVACESYMAVKAAKDSRLYKNIHCALCNRLNLEDISCWTDVVKVREIPNYSLYLDINDSHGLLKDQNENCSRKYPLHHTYDPFLKQCRNLRQLSATL